MKSLLINIKNLLPYLFYIVIYFFFVNIEARNHHNGLENKKQIVNKVNESKDGDSSSDVPNIRITIPVIPYNQ